MKKYLLPEKGNFYKANLHCHTTLSDGYKTPLEIKQLYKEKGYSIVAYTEHEIFLPHNDLTDESFLALNGFEMQILEDERSDRTFRKTCHLCFIALEKEQIVQPCWHRSKYVFANAVHYMNQVVFDENEPDFERIYTSEGVNEAIRIIREKGFFITYNHPGWSREDYTDYINYEGMHAMEIMNGGATRAGYEDYNPRVYDDILRSGKKLYCIGADDNHNFYPDDSPYSDAGRAFTMVKAENLGYRTITEALEAGHFYASEGPEIYELYVEEDKIHIKCSEAEKIFCTYEVRKADAVYSENGVPVTEATFSLEKNNGYIRITVVDKYGKHACTNAYNLEGF